MLYFWTKECEICINDIKYDRKAVSNAAKKFASTVNKLPSTLTRGAWRNIDDALLPMHKLRLETMITVRPA